MSRLDAYCGVRLKALPDFLLDHTLLASQPHERLPELCIRATQMVQRLWSWSASVFCLRFTFDPAEGDIRMYLLARSSEPGSRDRLQRDLELVLMAHGVVSDVQDHTRCVRLLRTEEIASAGLTPEVAAAMRRDVEEDFTTGLRGLGPKMEIVGLTQEVSGRLWHSQQAMDEIWSQLTREGAQSKPAGGMLRSWLPLGLGSPRGSYLLPMQALVASPVRVVLDVFAQPIVLTTVERRWLELLRMKAQQSTGTPDRKDVAAEAFAQQAAHVFRRLANEPWLVAAQVAAESASAARSVADSLRVVIGTPNPSPEHEAFSPPAAVLHVPASVEHAAAARQAHDAILFPMWMADSSSTAPPTGAAPRPKDLAARPNELSRLAFIEDAAGVSSLFRFPISVRGGIPGVDVEQPSPDFAPGPKHRRAEPAAAVAAPMSVLGRSKESARMIRLGRFESGGAAFLDVEQFKKHTLITGFTGSGKSTTVRHLLHELWTLPASENGGAPQGPNGGGIPFLVIESAKREYRGMLGLTVYREGPESMMVFTLGNETCAPFRMNPFALMAGMRVEAHIARLQACFEAALPPLPWLPSVLAEALEKLYKRFAWTLTDTFEPDAVSSQGPEALGLPMLGRKFPSMRDFYHEVESVVEERDYQGESRANVKAATVGRLKQLLVGSAGFMFSDTQGTGTPMSALFERPCVLELNDLNLQDKALITMFVLMFLREYRELHPSDRMTHVTVVEEAHNILGQVESKGSGDGAGADTRAKAVEAFCNMLAEVRSLGEGLIISDQSPNKLAPDAMRNTNVQIAHQLRDGNDREAMANAMIMDEEQRDFLGKLAPGRAAVFYTGLPKATFLAIPDSRTTALRAFIEPMRDPVVRGHMKPFTAYRRSDVPFHGCSHCPRQRECPYRPGALEVLERLTDSEQRRLREVQRQFGQDAPEARDFARVALVQLSFDVLKERGAPTLQDVGWCMTLHLLSRLNAADVRDRPMRGPREELERSWDRIRNES